MLQEGIPEWNKDTTYNKGSILKAYSGTTLQNYVSLVDDNLNNAVTDTTKWKSGLANSDLSNLTEEGEKHFLKQSDKTNITNWSFPSNKNIDLTLGASGSTYTAPANGWVSIKGTSTSTVSYIHLLILMDNDNEYYGDNPVNTVTNGSIATVLPIKKGDRYQVRYESLKNLVFRFIYAEGSK